MPNTLRVPKYRRHKPTGQAVVTLSGKGHYLGKRNTKASKADYRPIIGEWLAGGGPGHVGPRHGRRVADLRGA